MFESIHLISIIFASVAVFLFGWLWYSPILFSKPCMDAVGRPKDAERIMKEMPKIVVFGFFTTLIMVYALAVIFVMIQPESLIAALRVSLFICFSFIITTKFNALIYQSREPYWSKRPQLIFLITSGYYIGSFVIATEIIWFFANGMSI
jgi:hypothetical protein